MDSVFLFFSMWKESFEVYTRRQWATHGKEIDNGKKIKLPLHTSTLSHWRVPKRQWKCALMPYDVRKWITCQRNHPAGTCESVVSAVCTMIHRKKWNINFQRQWNGDLMHVCIEWSLCGRVLIRIQYKIKCTLLNRSIGNGVNNEHSHCVHSLARARNLSYRSHDARK